MYTLNNFPNALKSLPNHKGAPPAAGGGYTDLTGIDRENVMNRAQSGRSGWRELLDSDRFLIGAHRGARSLAPENTLAAARAGLRVGADFWELDVTLTADDRIVVIHDDTLTRTSNAAEVFPDRSPWLVSEFSLAELGRLDFGTWFVREDPFGRAEADQADQLGGQTIPTLNQALLWTIAHGWPVNVEIKNQSTWERGERLCRLVLKEISALGGDLVLVSSFNHEYLSLISAAAPDLPLGVLVQNRPPDAAALVKGLGGSTYHPHWEAVPPWEATRLKKAGVKILAWTVNEFDRAEAIKQSGGRGVITDLPQDLIPLRG